MRRRLRTRTRLAGMLRCRCSAHYLSLNEIINEQVGGVVRGTDCPAQRDYYTAIRASDSSMTNQPIDASEYLTVPEAAKLMGKTPQWVRKLAQRFVNQEPDGIPAVRIGRDYLIRRADVENFQANPVGWKKGRPRTRQNKK